VLKLNSLNCCTKVYRVICDLQS